MAPRRFRKRHNRYLSDGRPPRWRVPASCAALCSTWHRIGIGRATPCPEGSGAGDPPGKLVLLLTPTVAAREGGPCHLLAAADYAHRCGGSGNAISIRHPPGAVRSAAPAAGSSINATRATRWPQTRHRSTRSTLPRLPPALLVPDSRNGRQAMRLQHSTRNHQPDKSARGRSSRKRGGSPMPKGRVARTG